MPSDASAPATTGSSASARVARELFLRAFLGGADPQTVGDAAARLASRVVDLWIPKGHVLYKHGDPAEHHFFVVSGEIEVRGADHRFTLADNSIVGIMDVTQNRPRSRTAVALRETHLLRLAAADWFDVLEDNFDFARGALSNIASGVLEIHVELEGRSFDVPPAASLRSRTGDLSFVDRALLLRSVPPFRTASVQSTVELIPHARARVFEPDELVAEPGAARTSIFVVADGTLGIVIGARATPFAPGTLVGGTTSLAPLPWPFPVRALTRARALEIDIEDVFDAMEEHFDLVRAALAELSRERELAFGLKLGAKP